MLFLPTAAIWWKDPEKPDWYTRYQALLLARAAPGVTIPPTAASPKAATTVQRLTPPPRKPSSPGMKGAALGNIGQFARITLTRQAVWVGRTRHHGPSSRCFSA